MSKKFGTFNGVFIPSFEAIISAIIFLIMPILVADVGLIAMLAIIFLAHSVTIATAFSLSDCASNLNNIGGGGFYALTKKSLGKAFGGSIGIMLFIAQSTSIGFHCIGFSVALLPIIEPLFDYFPLTLTYLQQVQFVATIFFLIIFIIVMTGADITIKIATGIFIILVVSLFALVAMPFFELTYQGEPIFSKINLIGNRPLTLAIFFSTFATFFPATTGISTGIGMSGDLKDPKKSIIKGTFAAIFTTLIIYIIMAIVYSFFNKAVVIKDYQGLIAIGRDPLVLVNDSYKIFKITILFGVLFASGSSALGMMMTAPRTLQFITKDNILPEKFIFLKKDFIKGGEEPRFAILAASLCAIAILIVGKIEFAAQIVGLFFIIVYGWVNGAAFLERASGNPGFRPTFKGSSIISLIGFLLSAAIIFLFNWKIGIGLFSIQFLLFYCILKFRENGRVEGVWWGALFSIITKNLKSLRKIEQDSKSWRPIITAISFYDFDEKLSNFITLSKEIASFKGLVHLNIIKTKKLGEIKNVEYENLPMSIIETENSTEAMKALIQSSHPSGLDTNTVFINNNVNFDIISIIDTALKREKNILFLKNAKKFKQSGNLDIWWRGEQNGNFMILLAYIINNSLTNLKKNKYNIRIIRALEKETERGEAELELKKLLALGRINAEIITVKNEKKPVLEIVKQVSSESALIFMGLPGTKHIKNNHFSLFKLDTLIFKKFLTTYNDLPTILFIKSAKTFNITED